MRRAAKVDENQRTIVSALRRVGCEVLSLAAVGNGCPDLLCCRAGHLFMLEVKSPFRPRITPHQRVFHERWPVIVVNNENEALEAAGLLGEDKCGNREHAGTTDRAV